MWNFFKNEHFLQSPKKWEVDSPGAFSKWQLSIVVLIKRYSENMQQIYRKRDTC